MKNTFIRYPAGNLYSTSEQKYVNLEHVATLIRCGQTVCVKDGKTRADITHKTLLRIVSKQNDIPMHVLERLISEGASSL
jgi:polyhydroxyalkanoate synthesis regulator protein